MQPVYVLFGTESGNAQGLAKRTGEALEKGGFSAKVVDMQDFEGPDLEKLRLLVIITSTYGNGDPPSNAEVLHAYLMRKCPPLPELAFSVCALGDTTYDRFANCGKEFDEKLAALGANRLVPRQDCDVDYEKPFADWLKLTLDALGSVRDQVGTTIEPPPVVVQHHADAPGTRRNPVSSKVVENRNLNLAGSDKETRHLVLTSANLPTGYEPGDSIGLWPVNDPALVEAIALAAGASLDAEIEVEQKLVSLREALSKRFELLTPDARLVTLLRGELAPDEVARTIAESHVIDLIEAAKRPLSPEMLCDHLRPLAPRLYSVASSPRAHPGEVHLLVDILRYDLAGRARMGVTSHQVVNRALPGAELSIYLHPTPSFRLANKDDDIIMIGPGTGVAPFRAFLEDRALSRGKGRSWLFFGSRRRATDYLYEEDFARFAQGGVLEKTSLAFSRDQQGKVYVQNRMHEEAKELHSWIEGGATVYVCGDAKKMAPDVHAALLEILSAQGGISQEAAKAKLEDMEKAGRYLRDVY
ncbi:MAG: sulfite reductase [NADPH] flavoprotein alpha-component [Polyangiaceae bacterium]|nr:sulfite reductase [NADPH] flavoprotein alpha-component [Polyangiaceae bacterium]